MLLRKPFLNSMILPHVYKNAVGPGNRLTIWMLALLVKSSTLQNVVSSLPADVLCHLCRLLMQACRKEDPEPDERTSCVPSSNLQPYFALRSCSKALKDCCDEVRDSILLHEQKQDQLETYLRKLLHVRAVSIFYDESSGCYIWSEPHFPSLHSILPELESLTLICKLNSLSSQGILTADKDDVLLWKRTLQRLRVHCFSIGDVFESDDDGSLTCITQLTNLHELELINCNPEVQTKDIKGCARLKKLRLKHYQLDCMSGVQLDLSFCPLLQEISCTNYNIESLGLHGLSDLRVLECNNSYLADLDLSSCTALTCLECSESRLAELDLSNNNNLQVLDCSDSPITELNLSSCLNLRELCCNSCSMTELNLSACTALTTLQCVGLKAARLDVKACSSLQFFHADNCSKLSNLDLSHLPFLRVVTLTNSSLTSLDVSHCEKLDTVNCQGSRALTSLILLGSLNIKRLCLRLCGQLSINLAGCFLECN